MYLQVMLRHKHLEVEMASLSANLSHRANGITHPVESLVSHCKDRNVMRTPDAGDVAVNAKINNVVEGDFQFYFLYCWRSSRVADKVRG